MCARQEQAHKAEVDALRQTAQQQQAAEIERAIQGRVPVVELEAAEQRAAAAYAASRDMQTLANDLTSQVDELSADIARLKAEAAGMEHCELRAAAAARVDAWLEGMEQQLAGPRGQLDARLPELARQLIQAKLADADVQQTLRAALGRERELRRRLAAQSKLLTSVQAACAARALPVSEGATIVVEDAAQNGATEVRLPLPSSPRRPARDVCGRQTICIAT